MADAVPLKQLAVEQAALKTVESRRRQEHEEGQQDEYDDDRRQLRVEGATEVVPDEVTVPRRRRRSKTGRTRSSVRVAGRLAWQLHRLTGPIVVRCKGKHTWTLDAYRLEHRGELSMRCTLAGKRRDVSVTLDDTRGTLAKKCRAVTRQWVLGIPVEQPR